MPRLLNFPLDLSLYVITESFGDISHMTIAEAAYAGGAGVVQYRHKNASTREMLLNARVISEIAKNSGKALIINDRIDIALAVKADGVHLGPDDMPVSVARRIMGPMAIIGVSTGSIEEAIEAEAEGASYIGVGCIYGTNSKPDAGDAIGIKIISEIKSVVNIPVVAIGGINITKVPELLQQGADGIAVISSITRAKNIKSATRDFIKTIKNCRK